MNAISQRNAKPGTVNAQSPEVGRGDKLAAYVAAASSRAYPEEIVAAARVALVDYMGVAVGAVNEPGAIATRKVAQVWAAPGNARIFGAGTTNPALAALVNGTMAHCMDYDDTHLWGGGHISTPCWSAALAVGSHRGLDEKSVIGGFITGYEIMARLGGGGIRGVGRSMQQRGLHPTGINGVVAAAGVAAALMGFDQDRSHNALSIGATSASGLVASFGSDSKPYHGGKAAMDGILAADLANAGFRAARTVFERRKGMLDAFIQDLSAEVPDIEFEDWELLNNGYKPFACCRATHASIQAAHTLTEAVKGRKIKRVRAKTHANAPFTAGKTDPQTPLDCKFSVPFTIAMALRGYRATEADFSMQTLLDPEVRAIYPHVKLLPQANQPQFEAYLEVDMEDGETLYSETRLFLGHPDNPMTADDRKAKFLSLTEPVLGDARAVKLLGILETFERPGSLSEAMRLVDGANLVVKVKG
ncbi:MmgE/PrpD family protein [Corticibacterium sp. UT-5YL-CI-8]|nr:MmgE/PrpD family protein [Tianweitania sp. UT-5YL-CI-8]